jgi:hypothetical protein
MYGVGGIRNSSAKVNHDKYEIFQISLLFRYVLKSVFLLMTLPAHSGPRPLIQFRNNFLQTVGLFGRAISPSQGLYLHTEQHKHRINAYTDQTCMP